MLSDEQMSNGCQFSLLVLNDEQMSNWLGVEHQPDIQLLLQNKAKKSVSTLKPHHLGVFGKFLRKNIREDADIDKSKKKHDLQTTNALGLDRFIYPG